MCLWSESHHRLVNSHRATGNCQGALRVSVTHGKARSGTLCPVPSAHDNHDKNIKNIGCFCGGKARRARGRARDGVAGDSEGSAGGQRHCQWHFPKFPPPSPKPLRSRPLPAARTRPSTWNQKKTLFHVSRHQRAGAASTSRATRATFRGVGRTCYKRLRKKMLFLRLGIRCWMGACTGNCQQQAWAPR